MEKHIFLPKPRQKRAALNLGFKNQKCIFVLKQYCFEKQSHFMHDFCFFKTIYRDLLIRTFSFWVDSVAFFSISQSKPYLKVSYISKHSNISNQYLKTLQYLKPISQSANISTCLSNISTCLKTSNISKCQYLNLPQNIQYLKKPISQLA